MPWLTPETLLPILGLFTAVVGLLVVLAKTRKQRTEALTEIDFLRAQGEISHDESQDKIALRLIDMFGSLNVAINRFADTNEEVATAQREGNEATRQLIASNLQDRQFFQHQLANLSGQVTDIHHVLIRPQSQTPDEEGQ